MGKISFTKRGSGKPAILLHGFPMNKNIWNAFAEELSKRFLVYTPDIPGFGESEILPSPFSLEDVADELLGWVEENNIRESVIVGHSMGGYIALAMIEKKPELFSGIGLFHSTAYADSEEKKESRLKVVKFIDDNGVLAFTSNFIEPLFADANHNAIPFVKDVTIKATAEAVKGYTIAMRNRQDRLITLKKFNKPVLFIAGDCDAGIPVDSIALQATSLPNATVLILKVT